jgi:hypothetical protein
MSDADLWQAVIEKILSDRQFRRLAADVADAESRSR